MKKVEQRLLKLFNALDRGQQDTLIAFAEFLASRVESEVGLEPEALAINQIPRPENESVIEAIKRLSATYPMLKSSKILSDSSELVSQHMLRGRNAREVIDDLEQVFRRHYEEYVSKADDDS
jgi:hypothetical protein